MLHLAYIHNRLILLIYINIRQPISNRNKITYILHLEMLHLGFFLISDKFEI